MQYTNVFINCFAFHLPEEEVLTSRLEDRLAPVYQKLKIPHQQLEALTGIKARRWWPENFRVSDGALMAAEKALAEAQVAPDQLDALIYAGVCRDYFEPATACRIGAELGLRDTAMAYDLSNACLGVMNGIIDIANRIQLGQIRAGMVVSCESSRDVTEQCIEELLQNPEMKVFRESLATMTGGSGAAAVILSDGSIGNSQTTHQLLGAANRSSLEHHGLCRWGLNRTKPGFGWEQFLTTDPVGVLRYGLNLGLKTWNTLMAELGWCRELVDKVIAHQVGRAYRTNILSALGIPGDRDYSTFETLGNIGTVSLPLTAAKAHQQGFLARGDQVGLLGIGSGLNCLMMGVKW